MGDTHIRRSIEDPLTVRREINALKDYKLFHLMTMEVTGRFVCAAPFSNVVVWLFAAVALVIATVGIYGVISYAVRPRTRGSAFEWPWARKRATCCVWWSVRNEIGPGRRCGGVCGGPKLTRVMKNLLFKRERDRSGDLRLDRLAASRSRSRCQLHPGAESDESRSDGRAATRMSELRWKDTQCERKIKTPRTRLYFSL